MQTKTLHQGPDFWGPWLDGAGRWVWGSVKAGGYGYGTADTPPLTWLSKDDSRVVARRLGDHLASRVSSHEVRPDTGIRPIATATKRTPVMHTGWSVAKVQAPAGTGMRTVTAGPLEIEAADVGSRWVEMAKWATGWAAHALGIRPTIHWFRDERVDADRGFTVESTIWLNAAALHDPNDAFYVAAHECRHAKQLAEGHSVPETVTRDRETWRRHPLEVEANLFAAEACRRYDISSTFIWEHGR